MININRVTLNKFMTILIKDHKWVQFTQVLSVVFLIWSPTLKAIELSSNQNESNLRIEFSDKKDFEQNIIPLVAIRRELDILSVRDPARLFSAVLAVLWVDRPDFLSDGIAELNEFKKEFRLLQKRGTNKAVRRNRMDNEVDLEAYLMGSREMFGSQKEELSNSRVAIQALASLGAKNLSLKERNDFIRKKLGSIRYLPDSETGKLFLAYHLRKLSSNPEIAEAFYKVLSEENDVFPFSLNASGAQVWQSYPPIRSVFKSLQLPITLMGFETIYLINHEEINNFLQAYLIRLQKKLSFGQTHWLESKGFEEIIHLKTEAYLLGHLLGQKNPIEELGLQQFFENSLYASYLDTTLTQALVSSHSSSYSKNKAEMSFDLADLVERVGASIEMLDSKKVDNHELFLGLGRQACARLTNLTTRLKGGLSKTDERLFRLAGMLEKNSRFLEEMINSNKKDLYRINQALQTVRTEMSQYRTDILNSFYFLSRSMNEQFKSLRRSGNDQQSLFAMNRGRYFDDLISKDDLAKSLIYLEYTLDQQCSDAIISQSRRPMDSCELLHVLNTRSTDELVLLLFDLAERRFGVNLEQGIPLANPSEWAETVQKFLQVLTRNKDRTQEIKPEVLWGDSSSSTDGRISTEIKRGEGFLQTVLRLKSGGGGSSSSSSSSNSSPNSNSEFWNDRLLKPYGSILSKFQDHLIAFKKEYIYDRFFGFDPWGRPDQAVKMLDLPKNEKRLENAGGLFAGRGQALRRSITSSSGTEIVPLEGAGFPGAASMTSLIPALSVAQGRLVYARPISNLFEVFSPLKKNLFRLGLVRTPHPSDFQVKLLQREAEIVGVIQEVHAMTSQGILMRYYPTRMYVIPKAKVKVSMTFYDHAGEPISKTSFKSDLFSLGCVSGEAIGNLDNFTTKEEAIRTFSQLYPKSKYYVLNKDDTKTQSVLNLFLTNKKNTCGIDYPLQSSFPDVKPPLQFYYKEFVLDERLFSQIMDTFEVKLRQDIGKSETDSSWYDVAKLNQTIQEKKQEVSEYLKTQVSSGQFRREWTELDLYRLLIQHYVHLVMPESVRNNPSLSRSLQEPGRLPDSSWIIHALSADSESQQRLEEVLFQKPNTDLITYPSLQGLHEFTSTLNETLRNDSQFEVNPLIEDTIDSLKTFKDFHGPVH